MFNFILHYLAQINQICQILAALLTIAQWIRQLRKEKLGLTQEGFAEMLNVEPRTVQRWEKGDRKPRQEYMLKMQEINKAKEPYFPKYEYSGEGDWYLGSIHF